MNIIISFANSNTNSKSCNLLNRIMNIVRGLNEIEARLSFMGHVFQGNVTK